MKLRLFNFIRDIRSWILSNKLWLDDRKPKFLFIKKSLQIAKVDIDFLQVGSANVNPVPLAKYFGSWFHSKLTMETLISKV